MHIASEETEANRLEGFYSRVAKPRVETSAQWRKFEKPSFKSSPGQPQGMLPPSVWSLGYGMSGRHSILEDILE
ncbi:Brain-Enriched Guanylate Kinase-Associated Protein [Manis pentadactyla]|nr:Brain-Enriched Guanylate Kinase-Associated Protein [Manis pentadactyla]